MAVGQTLRRIGMIRSGEIEQFNKVAFYVFIPIMLFYDIYQSDLSQSIDVRYCLCAVGLVLLLYGISAVIIVAVEKAPDKRGTMIQGAFRSNYALLGIPMSSALYQGGDIGLTALLVAIMIPIYNIMSVITLEVFRGGRVQIKALLINIAKNPLIIGALCGLFFKIFQLHLPSFLDSFASKMHAAAAPVVLLLLGAAFNRESILAQCRNTFLCAFLKLIMVPGVGLTLAMLVGFRDLQFITLITVFTTPTAVNSYNMAHQMGGDSDLAAGIVMATTALSLFTMLFWITLFKQLGAF